MDNPLPEYADSTPASTVWLKFHKESDNVPTPPEQQEYPFLPEDENSDDSCDPDLAEDKNTAENETEDKVEDETKGENTHGDTHRNKY